jgi:hypothetical protein
MFRRLLRRSNPLRCHIRNASLFGKEYKEDHMTNLTPRIINNLVSSTFFKDIYV